MFDLRADDPAAAKSRLQQRKEAIRARRMRVAGAELAAIPGADRLVSLERAATVVLTAVTFTGIFVERHATHGLAISLATLAVGGVLLRVMRAGARVSLLRRVGERWRIGAPFAQPPAVPMLVARWAIPRIVSWPNELRLTGATLGRSDADVSEANVDTKPKLIPSWGVRAAGTVWLIVVAPLLSHAFGDSLPSVIAAVGLFVALWDIDRQFTWPQRAVYFAIAYRYVADGTLPAGLAADDLRPLPKN